MGFKSLLLLVTAPTIFLRRAIVLSLSSSQYRVYCW